MEGGGMVEEDLKGVSMLCSMKHVEGNVKAQAYRVG
uniref:Uncharacterized protein n=1 Tax=Vitis vinifera TaxID=29760 RepID=F6HCN5_VITVI